MGVEKVTVISTQSGGRSVVIRKKLEEILSLLCWITILGGVLIMMGQHSRSEALFYYFRLEDQVPETHLLRLIENTSASRTRCAGSAQKAQCTRAPLKYLLNAGMVLTFVVIESA